MLQDPFAEYAKPGALSSFIGIRMEDVQLKHYKADKLVEQAVCDRIDVGRDRESLDILGLRDGQTQTTAGPIRFSAGSANYSDISRMIAVTNGAYVVGPSYNLSVNTFSIDTTAHILQVSGRVSGRLGDGTITGMNLNYNLANGDFTVEQPDWTGYIAGSPDQGERSSDETSNTKTQWHIYTKEVVSSRGDTETFPKATANTTDGETIIKADMVVRDRKTDVVTATGNVKYFSKRVNLTCDKAVVYRKDKHAVFTGNVHCYFKGEDEQKQPVHETEIPPFRPLVPDEIAASRPAAPPGSDQERDEIRNTDNARKYPVTAQASRIEYWYTKGSRHAVITGDLQARQDFPKGGWRHLWSIEGYYDGEAETLLLKGPADKQATRVIDSLGDDVRCDSIKIWTEDSDRNHYDAANVDMLEAPEEPESNSPSPATRQQPGPPTTTPPNTSPAAPPASQPGTPPATQPSPLPGTHFGA
jgi:hypothetical protein